MMCLLAVKLIFPYPDLKPATKQAVINMKRLGNTLSMISRGKIGLPVFRNESREPPRPIMAPPNPTNAKPGRTVPFAARMLGSRKIVSPATPWTIASTMVDTFRETGRKRVRITAENPRRVKSR